MLATCIARFLIHVYVKCRYFNLSAPSLFISSTPPEFGVVITNFEKSVWFEKQLAKNQIHVPVSNIKNGVNHLKYRFFLIYRFFVINNC